MFKISFVGTILFIAITASETFACVDLSHIFKLGGGDIHVVQSGCEKLKRETYFNNEPMGDINEILISNEWLTTNINDDYETFTSNQRWMWNTNSTKLIHEYVNDTFNKNDSSRTFNSGSDIYEMSGDQVKKSSVSLKRVETNDGQIKIESKQNEEHLARIKQNL